LTGSEERMSNGMMVKDLIAELRAMPQDAAVRIKQPAHDYWRTVTTVGVGGVEVCALKWNGYHSTFVVSNDAEGVGDDEPTDKSLVAVVIG
jgi:hypothetical protein